MSEETAGCYCVCREQDLPEPTGWARVYTLLPTRICFSHTHLSGTKYPSCFDQKDHVKACRLFLSFRFTFTESVPSCYDWEFLIQCKLSSWQTNSLMSHLFTLTDACCPCLSFLFLPLSGFVRTLPDSQRTDALASPLTSHRLNNGHSSEHRPGTSNGVVLLTPCNSATSSRAARSVTSLLFDGHFLKKKIIIIIVGQNNKIRLTKSYILGQRTNYSDKTRTLTLY